MRIKVARETFPLVNFPRPAGRLNRAIPRPGISSIEAAAFRATRSVDYRRYLITRVRFTARFINHQIITKDESTERADESTYRRKVG
jgi:hypothetical protein